MSRWFQEQRDKWLLRQLQMVGFTTVDEIMEKFDIKMMVASQDLVRFEVTYPGMTRREGRTFRLKIFPWRFPGTDSYFCIDCSGGGSMGFEKCESCQATCRVSAEIAFASSHPSLKVFREKFAFDWDSIRLDIEEYRRHYSVEDFRRLYLQEWDEDHPSPEDRRRQEYEARQLVRDLTPKSTGKRVKLPKTTIPNKGDGIIRGGFIPDPALRRIRED